MKYISWADLVLGAWLVASPSVLGYAASRPIVLFWNIAPGILLLAVTCWRMVTKAAPLRLSWFQSLCGIWLIVASFVLLFERVSFAALDDLVVGMLVLAVYLAGAAAALRQPGTSLTAGPSLQA
jgi:hypothetical protein